MEMDYRLLVPLAVLSVISFISFFIENFALQREIEIASEKEDKLEATLRLLRRDIGEVSIGAAHVFVPFIILTLLGAVPNWVVWGAWLFVLTATVRLPLVHFSRGRGDSAKDKATKLFLPFVPFLMLSIPLVVALYVYTLHSVVIAL